MLCLSCGLCELETSIAHPYSQVVELPRVLYRAQRCGILDQKHIDLALQFFHDTGTIILLSKYSF